MSTHTPGPWEVYEDNRGLKYGKRYIEVCCCGDCPYLQNFGGAGSFRDDFCCGNQAVKVGQKIDGKFLVDGFPDFCPIEKSDGTRSHR